MSLQQLINQHRAALLAREQAASAEMARSYDLIWQRIQARLHELLTKMQQAQASGKDIKVSWLYEADRLAGDPNASLLPQVVKQFNIFAQSAGLQTRNLALSGFQLGSNDALSLLRASLPGIDISFSRIPHGALADLLGSFHDESPVARLFAGFGDEAAQLVKNALIGGVALGKNPNVIARDVQQALSVPLSRAIVVSRTETIRAYRSANLATYRANDDVVDGWIWSAALSARTCAMCIAMNGTEHPLSEEFASHPSCRCAPIPKTKTYAALGYSGIPEPALGIVDGEAWFAQQKPEVQRAILGSDIAYKGYASGQVSLADFVGVSHSKEWGTSRYQKSAKQLGIAS